MRTLRGGVREEGFDAVHRFSHRLPMVSWIVRYAGPGRSGGAQLTKEKAFNASMDRSEIEHYPYDYWVLRSPLPDG